MTYFNQSLTWKSVSSVNAYNEPTYATLTIKGRKESIYKQVPNQRGEIVIASARVFTETLVEVGDLIDDHKIIRVDTIAKLNGTAHHYEVYLQ